MQKCMSPYKSLVGVHWVVCGHSLSLIPSVEILIATIIMLEFNGNSS